MSAAKQIQTIEEWEKPGWAQPEMGAVRTEGASRGLVGNKVK